MDVADELHLPPQHLKTNKLRLDATGRYYYTRLHELCRKDAKKAIDKYCKPEQTIASLDSKTATRVMAPLLRLRQACCHPLLAKDNTISSAALTSTKTMKDVTRQMAAKAQFDCSDAFRAIGLAYNGAAGLFILEDKISQAIATYRDFIKQSHDYEKGEHPFKIDKLQLLHAMKNLVLMLEQHGPASATPSEAMVIPENSPGTTRTSISADDANESSVSQQGTPSALLAVSSVAMDAASKMPGELSDSDFTINQNMFMQVQVHADTASSFPTESTSSDVAIHKNTAMEIQLNTTKTPPSHSVTEDATFSQGTAMYVQVHAAMKLPSEITTSSDDNIPHNDTGMEVSADTVSSLLLEIASTDVTMNHSTAADEQIDAAVTLPAATLDDSTAMEVQKTMGNTQTSSANSNLHSATAGTHTVSTTPVGTATSTEPIVALGEELKRLRARIAVESNLLTRNATCAVEVQLEHWCSHHFGLWHIVLCFIPFPFLPRYTPGGCSMFFTGHTL